MKNEKEKIDKQQADLIIALSAITILGLVAYFTYRP